MGPAAIVKLENKIMAQTDTINTRPTAIESDAGPSTPESKAMIYADALGAAKNGDAKALDALVAAHGNLGALKNAKGQGLIDELAGERKNLEEAEKSARAILLLAQRGVAADAVTAEGRELRDTLDANDPAQAAILGALNMSKAISIGLTGDTNKDRTIDQAEFNAMMGDKQQREAFIKAVDKDGNGISRDEIQAYLAQSGLNVDDARIGGMANAVNNMAKMLADNKVKLTEMAPVAFAAPAASAISDDKIQKKSDPFASQGPGIG